MAYIENIFIEAYFFVESTNCAIRIFFLLVFLLYTPGWNDQLLIVNSDKLCISLDKLRLTDLFYLFGI